MTKPASSTISSMTQSRELSFSPTEVAHRAGGCGSTFRKLGDGPWSGTVFLGRNGENGELTVEETSSGWKVTDETGRSSSGRELEPLLKKVISR